MLNKKLVIAALLAAAHAQGEGAAETPAEEPAAETPAGGAETPAEETPAEGETPAAEGETPAAGGEGAGAGAGEEAPAGGAETPAEGGEGAGEGGAKDGEGSDEEEDLFEKARARWKEEIDGPDGAKIERVLCDQGEDALWEDAQKHWKGLVARKKEVDEEVAAQLILRNAANGVFEEMKGKAQAHKDANAAYLAQEVAAKARVAELVVAAAGSIDVAALQAAVDALELKTTAAQDLVEAQLARVEALNDSKRTQDMEEGLWEERITAANTAKTAANDAKIAADADLADANGQVSTRSWLYETLSLIDVTKYAANCNANAKRCDWQEAPPTPFVASASTWAWPSNCDYITDEGGINEATNTCKVWGLSGDGQDGLVQAATAMKGAARGANAPTLLYLAYENADYTYSSSATPNAATNDSSKLLNALEQYQNWQTKYLYAEMLKVTAWAAKSGGSYASDDDVQAWVKDTDSAVAKGFHPLMQGSANATSYVRLSAAATAEKGTFADGTGTDTSITGAMQAARARAQAGLWFADWYLAAYNNEWDAHVGRVADKANVADWATAREIGKAEVLVANAQATLDAETKNLDAVTRWEAIAAQDGVDAQTDITRARELLKDLVADVVPIARNEFTARKALEEGTIAEATRAASEMELGDAAGASPATGARAVLAAATATKESVEAQQAFHDAREDWASDNLLPVQMIYDGMLDAQSKLQAKMDAAEDAFDHARDQCKRAAFEQAQEAREKAQAVAQATDAKVAEVKREYADKAAFADAGKVGALCHYPKVGADAAAVPRPACDPYEDPETQEKPICCGAAQRFLKDGTKLSIETCQLASATTYTYYPALPVDAVVAPTAETWRFQCISAAQKLAAAAAAALATGYMMA